jgi:glyoxylase-like metal-dependent hydrolase (beta-lactamase superfamily II)
MTTAALLADCLITEREARDLAAWVRSHGTEPGYVYITHPHADHFLGRPEILAAFPDAKPVALAETISATEEQVSPLPATCSDLTSASCSDSPRYPEHRFPHRQTLD